MDVYYSGEIKIGFGGAIGIILVIGYFVGLICGIVFFIRKEKAKQESEKLKEKLDTLDDEF